MNEQVAKYRQLYDATRDAILTDPLSKSQISAFQTQLNELKPVALSGLNQKLAQAYLDLISENLTYASHQLLFVLNLNHDHSTIPIADFGWPTAILAKTHAAE